MYTYLFGPVPLRRPCTLEDLAEITGIHVNEINKYLGTADPVSLDLSKFLFIFRITKTVIKLLEDSIYTVYFHTQGSFFQNFLKLD